MDNTLPSSTIQAIASLVVLFILATTFLALRIYARVSALRSWRLGTDDYVILAAWVSTDLGASNLAVPFCSSNAASRFSSQP